MVFDLNNFDRLPLTARQKITTVDICGIINGKVLERTCKTGSIQQRVPVILPCKTQCLLELWTPKYSKPAKFDKNWKSLSLVIVTGLINAGNILMGDKVVRVLRQQMYKAETNRFIWISGQHFWTSPTMIEPEILRESMSLNWPDPIPFLPGYLKSSKGSIKTKNWAKIYPAIHSDTLEPYIFEDFRGLFNKVRKSMEGFQNLYTMKRTTADLIFDR